MNTEEIKRYYAHPAVQAVLAGDVAQVCMDRDDDIWEDVTAIFSDILHSPWKYRAKPKPRREIWVGSYGTGEDGKPRWGSAWHTEDEAARFGGAEIVKFVEVKP